MLTRSLRHVPVRAGACTREHTRAPLATWPQAWQAHGAGAGCRVEKELLCFPGASKSRFPLTPPPCRGPRPPCAQMWQEAAFRSQATPGPFLLLGTGLCQHPSPSLNRSTPPSPGHTEGSGELHWPGEDRSGFKNESSPNGPMVQRQKSPCWGPGNVGLLPPRAEKEAALEFLSQPLKGPSADLVSISAGSAVHPLCLGSCGLSVDPGEQKLSPKQLRPQRRGGR